MTKGIRTSLLGAGVMFVASAGMAQAQSADGVSVAMTRQNAGTSVSGCPGPPPLPGATKAPAATGCAIVIVV